MPKKLTYEFVKSEFSKKGYILLSKKYVNSTTKLDYICDKGHQHSISWGSFQQEVKCPYCVNNNIKLTLEFIRQEFAKRGYKLLSNKYVNAHKYLDFICNRGHKYHMRWASFSQGKKCLYCYHEDMKTDNPNSKGGVKKLNLPLYETYYHQLNMYEETYLIEQGSFKVLGVRCLYCDKIFVPRIMDVRARLQGIKGQCTSEHRFYCSDGCKQACPIYKKKEWPEGYAPATSREMQPQFRKMVLERDNWACQKCGISKEIAIEVELHAHHIDPVSQNPIESCDVDNGIALCKECHIEVHQIPGCSLNELKCPPQI